MPYSGKKPVNPPGAKRQWLLDHMHYAEDDCLLWPFGVCHPGYGSLFAHGKMQNAHRYMCIITKGPPPSDKHHAAHSCGNRRCCNPRHISWKTPAENQLDRRKHGTQARGHAVAKITPAERLEIIRSTENPPTVAARYGITESRVRQLRRFGS